MTWRTFKRNHNNHYGDTVPVLGLEMLLLLMWWSGSEHSPESKSLSLAEHRETSSVWPSFRKGDSSPIHAFFRHHAWTPSTLTDLPGWALSDVFWNMWFWKGMAKNITLHIQWIASAKRILSSMRDSPSSWDKILFGVCKVTHHRLLLKVMYLLWNPMAQAIIKELRNSVINLRN